MLGETHDAVLLVVAGLYALVALMRAVLGQGRRASDFPPGWFAVPALVAAALVLLAVIW